jgi:preprotein translocase subunit YajC
MTSHLFAVLAQSGSTAPPQSAFGGSQLLMMGAMIVMFYFLLIRPQQRQRKELQKRIDSMQAGDKVVTVVIKIADSTMVEFDKTAVAHVIKKDA